MRVRTGTKTAMRTAVTLDSDVLEKVRRESRARALTAAPSNASRRRYKVKPFSMGYRPGLNYDDVESLIEFGEGENHR